MAATTWSPRTTFNRQSWLLANGEVVHEPALEESGSGLKVRVAGTNLTAYTKDVDELLLKAVDEVAAAKGTAVWMPVGTPAKDGQNAVGFDPATSRAKLHIVHDPQNRYAATDLWWTFKHPTLPIEATLVVRAISQYAGVNMVRPQVVEGRLVHPGTTLQRRSTPTFIDTTNGTFTAQESLVLSYDNQVRLREFVRDNPPAWDTSILSSERFGNERQAVEALLKKVRLAEGLATIQIPDLRDPAKPAWLELELFDTNVNSQFIADLTDYLDGAPTVEEAARLYQELIKTMRSVGVVMQDKTENQFQAALLSGNKEELTVTLGPVSEEGHQQDGHHRLSMHLPTGTFIVQCSLHAIDKNTIAEKWDEALMIAQLTGNEDELLAYAKRYAETEGERRVKKILKERKTGQSDS